MKNLILITLTLLTTKIFSQPTITWNPWFTHAFHDLNFIPNNDIENTWDLEILCWMTDESQLSLMGEETWQFIVSIDGDTLANDTILESVGYTIIESINQDEIVKLCWTFRIWGFWPNSHPWDPQSIEECYEVYYNDYEWVEYDGTNPNTLSINEINNYNVNDNKIYDIMGREINNISSLPIGSVYIKNRKKYIRTNEN
jgi:hypothetical protein